MPSPKVSGKTLGMNLFVADTFAQAEYWARKLDLPRDEWRYIREVKDTLGYSPESVTAYAVGAGERHDLPAILDALQARGITVRHPYEPGPE